MEEKLHTIDELTNTVKEYLDVRTQQAKLHFAEKTAKVLSNIISSAFVFLFLMVFIFFLLLACSVIVGKVLGGWEWGLLIVGGFSFLLGLIVKALRSKLIEYPLMNKLIQYILNEDEDDEN
ncbi:MAG: phage holin family protein [Bacteroidota bacterium]